MRFFFYLIDLDKLYCRGYKPEFSVYTLESVALSNKIFVGQRTPSIYFGLERSLSLLLKGKNTDARLHKIM